MEEAVSEEGDLLALGLGLRGVRVSDGSSGSSPRSTAEGRSPLVGAEEEEEVIKHIAAPVESERRPSPETTPIAQTDPDQLWRHPTPPVRSTTSTSTEIKQDDSIPNRILEVCKSRINSKGKGALHPGSTFKGTQTSGRSAYEVEVKIAVCPPSPIACTAG
jgi:hypothetical protein